MKTIVVCNQKGGTGKSMIADELAFSFERSGIPLAFYDMDAQGGTIHQTVTPEDAQVAVVDTPGALREELKDILASADLIVVPTRPTSRDIEPLRRMRKVIQAAAPKTPVIYILNGWNRHRASRDFMDWAVGEIGGLFQIPQSELIVQAGAAESSVVSSFKGSPPAKSILLLVNSIRKMMGFAEEEE